MSDSERAGWLSRIPEGDFVSAAPSYTPGEYLDLFHESLFACGEDRYSRLKYWFFDPTEHGYPEGRPYPLLIFLHGTSNSLVGKTCVNYAGAELFASPAYQADFQGAYILVPAANETRTENGVEGFWRAEYSEPLHRLIREFVSTREGRIGKTFLFGNSSGAAMALRMGAAYPDAFDALIPVGSTAVPDDAVLDRFATRGVRLFFAMGRNDEFHDFAAEVAPRLDKLRSLPGSFLFTPEWVRNGDHGIASINAGVEMGQHCLINAVQSNLIFDDGSPMDQRLPRGMTGWIDEVSRGGSASPREYISRSSLVRSGRVRTAEHISLYYEEYGSGDRIILSAQCGFYHRSMIQRLADLGYHIYCITLRGFHPSSLVTEDYGDRWYDVFAGDVVAFADALGISRFSYMGASHGAGVGWHLMLLAQNRVDAFVAMVPGPHSLAEGTMSYRQMLEQGIIQSPPPFDPPVDGDPARQARREYREKWISGGPRAFEEERKLDYGRPMMRFGTEEKLCEALRSITVPVLMIGGCGDPISTPALMMRTAECLPHCKWIMYSNCGHNIDTDLIEEVSDEADRFIRNALATGKTYLPAES